MNRLVLILSRLILIGLIALFVSAAVLVGVGRQLVAHVEEFQPEIRNWLSDITGHTIEFDTASGKWQDLSPRITMAGLRATAPGQTDAFLLMKEFSLEVNLGASLIHFRPVIKLWLDGAEFELAYTDHRFAIKNLPPREQNDKENKDPEEDDRSILDRIDNLVRQPHIQITDSRIAVTGFWKQPVTVSDINLGVSRQGVRKHFWADLVLQQENSHINARVGGDFSGSLGDLESVNGHLYSQVSAPELAPWMPLPVSELSALEVTRASGDIELWGTVHQGELERLTSRLMVKDLVVIHQGKQQQPPALKSVTGVAKWEGHWQGNWLVGFESLEVTGEDFTWRPQQLVLHSQKILGDKNADATPATISSTTSSTTTSEQSAAAAPRRYIGKLDRATLSPWVRYYAAFLDPDSKAYEALSVIRPEARLSDLVFEMEVQQQQVTDYRLSADLSDLTLHPKRWIPGLNNVSARVLLGKRLSVIDFKGESVTLDYPRLFRETLLVDEAHGALLIHNSPDELLIESGLMLVNDEQIKGATQLSVSKDKTSESQPYLRLQATLDQFNADFIHPHLPVGVIPDGVVRWLDQAVLGGTLLRGDLLFHGPTNLYEFEPFQYVLGFTVDDVQLSYLDGWRPVEHVAADVRIDSGTVDAWALSGDYYAASLNQARVGTRRVGEGMVDLWVEADLKGPVEQAIGILKDSPISDITAPILEPFSVSGQGDILVGVEVPFRKDQDPEVEVSVQVDLQQGQFVLKEPELVIDNLNGEVNFSLSEGLSSPGLTGRVFDGDISATIMTEDDPAHPVAENSSAEVNADKRTSEREAKLKSKPDSQPLQTVIRTHGSTRMSAIKPWLKLDMLAPFDGPFDYNAAIYIRNTPEEQAISRNLLEIETSLKDVQVNYPQPLKKSSGKALSLSYKTTLGGEKRFQSVQYGDLFDLKMVMEEDELNRGAIAFGEKAVLPEQPYFSINGTIETLDTNAWSRSVKKVDEARNNMQQGERSTGLLPRIDHSRLNIGTLKLKQTELQNLNLTWQREDGFINVAVDSPDVKGDARLPQAYLAGGNYRAIDTPVTVHLLELKLPENIAAATKTVQSEAGETSSPSAVSGMLDPRQLPALDLSLAQLVLGEEDFGSWQLRWSPVPDGVHFDSLTFDLKRVNFKGTGDWLWKAGSPETRIEGEAKAGNVADILEAWGYAPSLTSETARMSLKSQWRDAPFDFDLLTAQARFDLVIKEGRFRDVSSGTADKVLGALNFDDWLSRLRLKIKDLESNEMPYSEIRGEFELEKEILKTRQLKLDGAAMKMTMDGDLNLNSKTIDANLNVTIPVTRNLVLPAAAVGGLPAAATVYVIEKVLGSQLDKLTTMKYSVEGPLDDPAVSLQESFNIIPKQIQESIVKEGGQNGHSESDTSNGEAVEPALETETKAETGEPENSDAGNSGFENPDSGKQVPASPKRN